MAFKGVFIAAAILTVANALPSQCNIILLLFFIVLKMFFGCKAAPAHCNNYDGGKTRLCVYIDSTRPGALGHGWYCSDYSKCLQVYSHKHVIIVHGNMNNA